MKALKKHFLPAAVAGAVAMAIASPALAFPTFTINPLALPPGSTPHLGTEAAFQADFITGVSSELIHVGGGGTTNTVNFGWMEGTGFSNNGPAVSPLLTGLLTDYNLYVTFNLTATLASGPGGAAPGSTYSLTSLNVSVFGDPNTNTAFNPASAAGAGTEASVGNTADDILLAFGSLVTGTAGFDSLGGAFINAIDHFNVCNGVGTASLGGVAVVAPQCSSGVGSAFFAAPTPFYNVAFSEFNNTTQGIAVNGNLVSINQASGGVDFAVLPEPGSVALLGLVLGGLGLSARRGKKRHA